MVQTTEVEIQLSLIEKASRFHALYFRSCVAPYRKGVRSKLTPPAPVPIDRQQLPGSPSMGIRLP